MARLKVAQIGVLHEHASGLIRTLINHPDDFEVLGLAAEPEASPERVASFRKHHCPDVPLLSQEELLALPGLQGVLVETEMRDLIPTAWAVAKANLPMHIDKPAGSEELDAFVELAHEFGRRNLPLHPGYMFRGSHPINFAKAAVRKGWLGEIMEFDANMHRDDRDPHFRQWLATYAGGGVFDFASHIIDIVVDLFGEPIRVTPFLQRVKGDGLLDNGIAVLEYPHTIATVRCSLNTFAVRRRLTLRGTHGFLEINPIEPGHGKSVYPAFSPELPAVVTMVLEKDNDEYRAGAHEIPFNMDDRYIDMMRDFSAIVQGEKTSPYSIEHEILVQKTVLQCSGYPV